MIYISISMSISASVSMSIGAKVTITSLAQGRCLRGAGCKYAHGDNEPGPQVRQGAWFMAPEI